MTLFTDLSTLLVIGGAVLLVAATLVFDARQRRRERARRRDLTVLADAFVRAQQRGHKRPKADRRIQRRRFGSG